VKSNADKITLPESKPNTSGDLKSLPMKGIAESGWFAARPSGTEDIYKISAESFWGADHLRRILEETLTIVNDVLAAGPLQKPRILLER